MTRPKDGDFCYVSLTGRGVFEGTVLSSGRDYEIRLKSNDEVVEAPDSEVWTASPSKGEKLTYNNC